jgi:hypothetical protein
MRKHAGGFFVIILCFLLLPLALIRVYFQKPFFILAPILFFLIRFGPPCPRKKARPVSWPVTLLAVEFIMAALGVMYYVSDTRDTACAFRLDPRLTPLLTYRQCKTLPATRRDDCLAILDNPYGLALFENRLLVVSGLGETVLGRIPLQQPENFTVEKTGAANAQEIIVDQASGLAALPQWRSAGILIYDLINARPARSLQTRKAQLISTQRIGRHVYILSEARELYRLNLDNESVTRFPLHISSNTMYGLWIDPARGKTYLSDWVRGNVYIFKTAGMKLERRRFLWGMAGGLALDSRRCELYVARMLYSKVDVLDCKTLATRRTLRAGLGAHTPALDQSGRNLYLTNYFDGTFMALDARTGRRRAMFRVGPQIRDLLLDEKSHRLFLCSKCGVFEVKIK